MSRLRDVLTKLGSKLRVAQDLVYVVFSSALNNAALQFVLYPVFERRLGEERYGEALFLITLANVCGMAIGGSANMTYLTSRKKYKTTSGDFLWILSVLSAITLSVCAFFVIPCVATPVEFILGELLIWVTIFINYSFVDFQLRDDYRGYFIFSLITIAGCIAFLPLFFSTGLWALALVCGNLAGMLYVCVVGRIYKPPFAKSEDRGHVVKATLTLSGSQMINYGMQNIDRFLVLPVLGGTAVTLYYVASLLSKTLSMITGPINTLIIGYLSQKGRKLTGKMYLGINVLLLAGTAVFGAVVVVVSPLVLGLPILYPDLLEKVREWILPASIAQLLVIASSILIALDIVVAPPKMQMVIQSTYAVIYLILAFIMAKTGGLRGFVTASVIAGIIRYLVAFGVGMYYIERQAEEGYDGGGKAVSR